MTSTVPAGPISRLRYWRARLRSGGGPADNVVLGALSACAVLLATLAIVWPNTVPSSVMILPMFMGSLWLTPRRVPWLVVFCLALVCVVVAAQPTLELGSSVRILVSFAAGFLLLTNGLSRRRLGVTGFRSDSMFIDLRDRIVKQGQIPAIPQDWYIDSEIRSAEGTGFAGDFVVAGQDKAAHQLDVVVVDVSGKGIEAGTRSLLLSGAFGGLLSAVERKDFLPEANKYLLRQEWAEGFATAIHLNLDLVTGEFELRKAGHPPAVWFKAGSGTWQVLDSDGPALGLLEGMDFDLVSGTMRHGDALLLYTDGVVETSQRDYTSGIDKLAGRAQRLFQTGFEDGAKRVLDQLEETGDDRALLLIHRR